jgi:hypothetical protein
MCIFYTLVSFIVWDLNAANLNISVIFLFVYFFPLISIIIIIIIEDLKNK